MLTREENELLCRVEGDAPMGQIFRRHWQPICLIEEVNEPDGKPVRARMSCAMTTTRSWLARTLRRMMIHS